MTGDDRYGVSKATLRPLFDMYWSSSAGWRDPAVQPAEDDLRQAVDAGVMFSQPLNVDHDSVVDTVRTLAGQVAIEDVGRAFVASLSSRRLDLRSALGSFAIARLLPDHRLTPMRGERACGICGCFPSVTDEDLNVLSFERFKWGGVRRDVITYVAFDLQQFQRAPQLEPTEADIALGRDLIAALRATPPKMTAAQTQGRIAMVKSNKDERRVLMDILGVCGILEAPDHRGYARQFIDLTDRELPDNHFIDYGYPVCWWRGAYGVNDDALALFLPQLV